MIITESQLRRIIRQQIRENLQEGWKDKLTAGALALGAMGGYTAVDKLDSKLGSLFQTQDSAKKSGSFVGEDTVEAAKQAQKELKYTRRDLKSVLASPVLKSKDAKLYLALDNIDKHADNLEDGGNAEMLFNLYLKKMPTSKKLVDKILGRDR